MARLAIISTYNENCGNASYTHALKCAFEKYVEVDVIPLDLFLLQNMTPALIKAGDRHIKEICKTIKTYDYVNIQFEGGLYGASIPDILRRIKWLIDAAPNLILTMHRVDIEIYPFLKSLRHAIAQRSFSQLKATMNAGRFSSLSRAVVRYCWLKSIRKNVWIKVHTRREERSVRIIYRNKKVFDYPLVFLTDAQRKAAWAHNDRTAFLKKNGFEPTDKVVGLFGYISDYKGMDTAIEALSLLPKEYKLGIFGSQHPQTVKRGEPINPYLKSLLDLMDDVDARRLALKKTTSVIQWFEDQKGDTAKEPRAGNVEDKISERIRFIGSLPDPEFIEALRLCDAVVLPYLEVGQSMSGVVVLGMEAGAKLLCANNKSFSETLRYFPDTFLSFDMGNTIELAQKVVFCTNNPTIAVRQTAREKSFQKYHIDASVRVQLEKFGFTDF